MSKEIINELSIDIYKSSNDGNWYVSLHDTMSEREKDTRDEICGGVCAGTLEDAIEMANTLVKDVVKNNNK